jgi:hypothetical protein
MSGKVPQKGDGVKRDVTFKQLIASNFSDDNWEGPFSKLAITDAKNMLKEINTMSVGSDMIASKLDNDNMAITINDISPNMIQMTQRNANFKIGRHDGLNLVLDKNDIYSLYHMHQEIDKIDEGKYGNIIPNIIKMWEDISAAPAKKKNKKRTVVQVDMSKYKATEAELEMMMELILEKYRVTDPDELAMLDELLMD